MDPELREQARRLLGVALVVAERSVDHLIPLGRTLQVSGMQSHPTSWFCSVFFGVVAQDLPVRWDPARLECDGDVHCVSVSVFRMEYE